MFGLGGIYVEALRQVSFRLAPLRERDIEALLSERPATQHSRWRPRAPHADRQAARRRAAPAVRPVAAAAVIARDIADIEINPLIISDGRRARARRAGRSSSQEFDMRDITPLVAPRSIAVIGASANPTKSGGVLFDNLAKGNFHGPLYPINRTARTSWAKGLSDAWRRAGEGRSRLHRAAAAVRRGRRQAMRRRRRPLGLHHHGRIFAKRAERARVDEDRLREIAQARPGCCSLDRIPSAWSMPKSA